MKKPSTSRSPATADTWWEVTYLLDGGILASKTVKAQTKEAARERADRPVTPRRRILADKVEVERTEK